MKVERTAVLRLYEKTRSRLEDDMGRRVLVSRISGICWSIIRLLLLIGLVYIILYPIVFCISISIRQPNDMMDPTVVWLPKNLTLDNILMVLGKTDFLSGFMQTSLLSLLCSVLQMFSCAVTGYGFARFRFKGRNILFLAALLTFIVPPQIISMPLYIQYSRFTQFTAELLGGEGIQMINTVFPTAISALMGQGLKAGLFIYLFRQFFKGLPMELEDAAYLDGCGPIKAFTNIMLPNSAPMLLVSFILSFVWYWNDYINVALFFNSAKPLAVIMQTIDPILRTMRTADGLAFGDIEISVYTTTFCLMFILTPIIVYVFLQKRFTESLMSTSIVG